MQIGGFNPLYDLSDIYEHSITKKNNHFSINQFKCKVPVNGFIWDENADSINNLNENTMTSYLIEKSNIPQNYKYEDLSKNKSEKFLFWKFSKLSYSKTKSSKSLILKFANNYGFLFNNKNFVYTKNYKYNSNENLSDDLSGFQKQNKLVLDNKIYVPVPAESLTLWLVKVAEIRSIALLWKAILKNDYKTLRKIIKWENNQVKFILSPSFEALKEDDGFDNSFSNTIAGEKSNGQKINWEKFKSFKKDDLIQPAKLLLNKLFNNILRHYLFETKNNKAKIIFSNEGIEVHINNLLSYLWLEFYNLTSEKKEIGWCKLCGGPADITEKRSDWKAHTTCNKYKYQKKYRDLKAYERGDKSKEDIVESWKDNPWEEEVTINTVEKWIKDKKED